MTINHSKLREIQMRQHWHQPKENVIMNHYIKEQKL